MRRHSTPPAAGRVPAVACHAAAAVVIAAALALPAGPAAAAKRTTVLIAPATPAFVTRHLKRHLPGARIARARYNQEDVAAFIRSRRAPVQVVADFNGDRRRDWAGLVQGKDGVIRLVAIYSTSRGYRHTVLQKNVGQAGYPLRVSVHRQKPGRLKGTPTAEKPKSVRLRRPGVSFVYFEKSSVVFYWSRGRFDQIWTSD